MQTKKPLSAEKKSEIWLAINAAKDHKDRDPEKVIETDYKGNEENYLHDMANWMGIKITT